MLSMKCKYALKALVVLATTEGTLPSKAIAAKARVPLKFLEAILTDLRKADALTSSRGAAGGHVLKKSADDIMLGEVVRSVDGMLAPIPCASTFYYKKCDDCLDEKVCVIRRAMLEVRNKIAEVLDGLSLQDLVNMSPKKQQQIFW